MALPQTIPCRVSSEEVGYVTMARVASVSMPLDDLAGKILGVCGKDASRVAAILSRGSLVSDDTRYRWTPLEASAEQVAALLERFPDHDPDRSFDPSRCTRMEFRDRRGEFAIDREAGSQKRFLRRRSFWDGALAWAAALEPGCERYSYSDGADVFAADLTPEEREGLERLASRLRYSSLEKRLREPSLHRVALYVGRGPSQRD